uniref:Tub domain-containing protein n=1 Tax=Macrostomum lignano TaxID=282301 RepID=A0A1I8FAT5_9PLAT
RASLPSAARFDQSQLADAPERPAGDRQQAAHPEMDPAGALRVEAEDSFIQLIMRAGRLKFRQAHLDHITLSDGSLARRLRYTHGDEGVCSVRASSPANATARPSTQTRDPLVPAAQRRPAQLHWAGLYGRLDVEGFFSTHSDNPEPMGKQWP